MLAALAFRQEYGGTLMQQMVFPDNRKKIGLALCQPSKTVERLAECIPDGVLYLYMTICAKLNISFIYEFNAEQRTGQNT